MVSIVHGKFGKPWLRFGSKRHFFALPDERDLFRMKSLMRQNERGDLRFCHPAFDKMKVTVFVATVDLITDDWMPKICQMDTYLVLASAQRTDGEQGKLLGGTLCIGWRLAERIDEKLP